jgi:3-oxoacyl-[acyl-carrier protein] reductase
MRRPVALVTGVGRRAGIAAGIVARLASDGWDIAMTYWSAYDERMPWGVQPDDVALIAATARELGASVLPLEFDLADPSVPERLFGAVTAELGEVSALVLSHSESVDSGIMDTTIESFDRHMAINARGSLQLIQEFARQFRDPPNGRLVALTSYATRHNVPYGASKGALDRIVIAAAVELAPLGITANVINPGPIDTGWMTPDIAVELAERTPMLRLGTPRDTASLVSFLLSEDGGWLNGQLLNSDGGLSAAF